MTASPSAEKQKTRKQMRERRKALSRHEQHVAATQLVKIVERQMLFQRCQHISFYLANDGEIDPFHLMIAAHTMNKNCYLPVVKSDSSGTLDFVRYLPDSKLVANQYGIPEPVTTGNEIISPQNLDLVFLPLVAFDPAGGRLGMGAGYYDRTFAVKSGERKSRTKLIGLAHDFQRLEQLPTEEWDIPMHAVITESHVYTTGLETADGPYKDDFLPQDCHTTRG
ncbi:5-formyltetrahydrofolate cyclo-ligase [Aurantivibrio infirmus]